MAKMKIGERFLPDPSVRKSISFLRIGITTGLTHVVSSLLLSFIAYLSSNLTPPSETSNEWMMVLETLLYILTITVALVLILVLGLLSLASAFASMVAIGLSLASFAFECSLPEGMEDKKTDSLQKTEDSGER